MDKPHLAAISLDSKRLFFQLSWDVRTILFKVVGVGPLGPRRDSFGEHHVTTFGPH